MSATTQGELWSVAPEAWAGRAEARNRPLFDALLDQLGVRSGTRLLDVGCGAGLLCALAATRGAQVAGLDAAPGLLAVARGRNPDGTFVEGDIEALPFDAGAFDVVTAVNVLPYAENRTRAVSELRRVLARGGLVAATVGASAHEQECAALVDPLAPPSDVPDWEHQPDLRQSGVLADALAGAGLTVIDTGHIPVECHYAGIEDAVESQLPAGPVEAAVRHSGRSAVQEALAAFFGPRRRADGSVVLETSYRYAVGRADSTRRP